MATWGAHGGKFAWVSMGWGRLGGEGVGDYAMGEKELNPHLPDRKPTDTALKVKISKLLFKFVVYDYQLKYQK